MKLKLLSLIVILVASIGIHSNLNAATITAVATGNWSATGTWDSGTVPTSADEIIIPNGFTVTIDGTTSTCLSLTVQNGGIVIQNANFYIGNLYINSGGVFKSATSNSSNKSLFWGYLYTTAATPQTGDFTITNNGQFGGTVAGTADGIAIFFSELASNLTIDGTTTATCYLGRLLANNGTVHAGTNDLNLNIKQNLFVTNGSFGFSLQNNKDFTTTTTRTCTIYPTFTVTCSAGARFHASGGTAPSNPEGNITYNIYGTLDLASANTTYFDLYTSKAAGSTQIITVNVGNGTDYGVLKLGRNINIKRYFEAQAINLNWNNPKSRIVFGGAGAISLLSTACSGYYNVSGSVYVDDARIFPSAIRNLSYESTSTSAALTLPRKVTVTDTLYMPGYGHKFSAGTIADATARTVTLGKLFSLSNNAYVVTGVSSPLTTVTSTTLGAAGTWSKGATLTDASGNTFYCDSVGLYAGTVIFTPGTAVSGYEELTGAPVQVTGNVINSIANGCTARFSSTAYIGGNITNGAGTQYFAFPSTVGGAFTNGGTVSLNRDLTVGSLINNGSFAINANMLTLTNGNISGTNSVNGSTGIIQYAGTTDLTISGVTSNSFNSLRINTSGAITLGGVTTITGGLTLTKGKLVLGDNSLTPGSISGGSSSAYVVTNGTGKLSLTTVDATARLFPVGSSVTSYDPVTVTPTTGTLTSVKVSSTLSGAPVAGVKYNAREWDITPSVASSTVLAFIPSELDATVATRSTSPVIGHYVSGSYENNSSSFDDLTRTYTGTFDAFSPFVTGANIDVTALENTKNTLKVFGNKGQLIVNGVQEGEMVTVFGMNGQAVAQIKSSGTSMILNLNAGVYLVKTGSTTSKVIL